MNATPPAGCPGVQCISAATAAELLRNAPKTALFDVRDPAAFERDHLPGAEHLDESSAGPQLLGLSKDTPIVLYCYKGNASQVYGRMFVDFRFSQVFSVDGGRDALAAALAPAPSTATVLSPDLAAFIAEYGFDPSNLNAARQHGLTPLMRAALLGREALVLELLALGVAVNRRNDDGNTALWLACVGNQAGAVQALIAAGIDLNNRNDAGATALMYCASAGRDDMLALLLQAGADPYVRNQDDALAVDLCATVGGLKLLRHTAQ